MNVGIASVEPLNSGRRVHRWPTPFGASAHLTPPAGIGEWQPLRVPCADLARMNVARHGLVGGVSAIAISSSRFR